jgi:TPR repeat protein
VPEHAPPDAIPVAPPLRIEKTAALIQRGEDLLKRGDVSAARLFFKQAAVADSAQAALELAKTFDETFLRQWGIVGLAPDATQAREWYERANKLGSSEASRQLERLASVPK